MVQQRLSLPAIGLKLGGRSPWHSAEPPGSPTPHIGLSAFSFPLVALSPAQDLLYPASWVMPSQSQFTSLQEAWARAYPGWGWILLSTGEPVGPREGQLRCSALHPETRWSPSVHGLSSCRRNVGAPSDTLSPDSAQCAINRAGENSGHTLMLVLQEVLMGEIPECRLPVTWQAFQEYNTASPYLDDCLDLLPSGPQVAA